MGKYENKDDPNVCTRKKHCIYGANMGAMYICDYLETTGKPRPCGVKDCTEYMHKGKHRRKTRWAR